MPSGFFIGIKNINHCRLSLSSAKTQRKLKLYASLYDKLKAGFRFERSPPDDVGLRVIENGVCILGVKGSGFGFKGRRPPNPE